MKKALLLISAMVFMLSMNICYFKLATEVCELRIMRAWQWLSIGLFFLGILIFSYDCKGRTRTDKVLLLLCCIDLFYTMAVIILANLAIVSNPYPFIISYNNIALVTFFIVLIAGLYSRSSITIKGQRSK